DFKISRSDLIPKFMDIAEERKMLQYPKPDLKRCTRCILPETMPFIYFDNHGVCNYCNAYKPRNNPKPKEELFELVAPYRRKEGLDCIVRTIQSKPSFLRKGATSSNS